MPLTLSRNGGWWGLLLGSGLLLAGLLATVHAGSPDAFPPSPLPGYQVTAQEIEPRVLDYDGQLLGVRPLSLTEAYYTDSAGNFVHFEAFRLPDGASLEAFAARYRLLEIGPGVPCAPAASLSGALFCNDISSHGSGGVAVLGGRGHTFLSVLTHDPGTPPADALAYARSGLDALGAP